MKKSYLLLVFLVAMATVACDDDEVRPTTGPGPVNPTPTTPVPPSGPDVTNPIVRITAPAPNTLFTVIDIIGVYVTITDDKGLKETRTYLVDLGSGSRKLISAYNTAANPFVDDKDLSGAMFFHRSIVGLPQSATSVNYRMIIEAEDKNQNISKDSVAFTIHAPDLNREEFVKIASKLDMHQYMDWSGYTIPKDPEIMFSFSLFLMVDKDYDFNISDAEWNKFAADFDLGGEALATWDGDNNGKLSDDEFKKVIKKLKFYTDWDENKNSSVDPHELARGIFGRWDHNKDGLLSRAEYEERYFTYFHFE